MRYKNTFERKIGLHLSALGLKFEYEPFKIKYKLPIVGCCSKCGSDEVYEYHNYIPDFFIPELKMLIETKGAFSSKERTKMVSVTKNNPDMDIRIIFQKDNWCTKNHRERYSEWATRKGIIWAVGTFPPKWIEDYV